MHLFLNFWPLWGGGGDSVSHELLCCFKLWFGSLWKQRAGYCSIQFFLDCQSNPNPSHIYDWQSESKSTFHNGLTIQSKSNHNPTTFSKKQWQQKSNASWFINKSYCNSQETSFYLYCQIIVWKFWLKSLALFLEQDALWNFNFSIKNDGFFGFGLKWQNWIDNPNPQSDFDFGLSITIQSTKLDCNPDWAIHQSNPAIP